MTEYTLDLCEGGVPFTTKPERIYAGRGPERAFDNAATSYSIDCWAESLYDEYIDVGYDFGLNNRKKIRKAIVTGGRTAKRLTEREIQACDVLEGPWTTLYTEVEDIFKNEY